MNKNEYILSALLIVFSFGFGIWIGYEFGYETPYNPALEAAKESSDDTFDAGWKAAQQKVAQSATVINQAAVHTLNGMILDVGRGEFRFETTYKPRNPLADPVPTERVVEVTKATQIYKKRKRSAEEYTQAQTQYRKDMLAYREAVAQGKTNVRPPRPVLMSVKEEASIADLAEGQKVSVENLSENIEYAQSIVAETVYIIE